MRMATALVQARSSRGADSFGAAGVKYEPGTRCNEFCSGEYSRVKGGTP